MTFAHSDEWVLSHRGARTPPNPRRPYHFLIELERVASGEVVPVATIFLTNRECPWRCLMCDLWKNTLTHSVSPGDIPAQIEFALHQLGEARQVKLYNSGSFFDAAAIPPADFEAIADLLRNFERVIVESHPALIGPPVLRLQKLLRGQLEVAMGLETIHPEVLPRLNKRMSLDMFSRAAQFLREHKIDLRAFVLLKPPFLTEDEALLWAHRSIAFAFDCHATVASLIPVRLGNGALEALDFAPPKLASLETALAGALALKRGRVFADLWDLQVFSDCAHCFAARRDRLERMNFSQSIQPPAECSLCRATSI